MNKSESIVNLSKALAAAQGEMPAIKFDSTNGFLGNKFASLGAVIEATRPILAKHGLSIAPFPIGDGGAVGIEVILLHTSGEWISNSVLLEVGAEKGKSSAQVAGSIISYLRRYALSSICGVYADEDGDGNKPAPAELKAREEKKPVEAASVSETMTIEDACKTTTSEGKPYGEMAIVGLEKMLSAMHAKLVKSELRPEEKAEVERKIKAAQIVHAAKVNKEI
jgi:hypothetical protein